MMTNAAPNNLNDARSQATRQRLVQATVDSLVEIGFGNTTGVEVCRRAEVTRGALNHHFPVFVDLLIASLMHVYTNLRQSQRDEDDQIQTLERFVEIGYGVVIQPEFKAIVELWLASQNDEGVGSALRAAILEASQLFSPQHILSSGNPDDQTRQVYHSLLETLIGIGLGRATSGGRESDHEKLVYDHLIQVAKNQDSRGGDHG